MQFFERLARNAGWGSVGFRLTHLGRGAVVLAVLIVVGVASTPHRAALAQSPQIDRQAVSRMRADRRVPPREKQAQRFLALRGLAPGRTPARLNRAYGGGRDALTQTAATSTTTSTATWQTLGPTAVLTPTYGLVTGRVSAVALDPSDTTGNRLYIGTTGGGVWVAQNAGTSNAANVAFTPLTDSLAALSGIQDASISIGALTVQPGATGVILAGTGDPNDALDSYYGEGILRSADGGNTWSLIQTTADLSW